MAKPQEVEQVQDHEVDQKLKDRGYDVDWNQRLGGNNKRPGILTAVYKIKEPVNSSRETLAIKEIILEKASKFYERLYEQSKRELEIMKKLKSRNNKNIIKLINDIDIEFEVEKRRVVRTWAFKRKVITDKYRHIYFIMEYCDMSLQEYLEKYGGRLNPEEMKVFFRQIRTAKRKKCLKATLKIADFGFATFCNETSTCEIGTPMYIAPEVLIPRDDIYDSNADMWCVGTMIYRCLTGRLPYPVHVKSFEDQKAYFESIEAKESLVDDDLRLNNDPEWKNKEQELSEWKRLIKQLLKIQILDRMNFETFKKHPFVYNFIEGKIRYISNCLSFDITKKSAIQENLLFNKDDPNFFRHCMMENFSLCTSNKIDNDLQFIKERFDGKLLVQHLQIEKSDIISNSVFSWAKKLPKAFEFAEYSTLLLKVDEESFDYIVNNPSSIRFELIKSINVKWSGWLRSGLLHTVIQWCCILHHFCVVYNTKMVSLTSCHIRHQFGVIFDTNLVSFLA